MVLGVCLPAGGGGTEQVASLSLLVCGMSLKCGVSICTPSPPPMCSGMCLKQGFGRLGVRYIRWWSQ